MKEPEKLHQLPTSFKVSVWSLLQGVYKVVWVTGLNVNIESSGMFLVCHKNFLGELKWSQTGSTSALLFSL